MRTIVVGQLAVAMGVQTIEVWYRFPVPAARQSYYQKTQAAFQPQAPGDYAAADLAEISQFQTGQWVERAGFGDVIDPTSSLATIQSRLVNIYGGANTAFANADNAALARWGSYYDGAWTMKAS